MINFILGAGVALLVLGTIQHIIDLNRKLKAAQQALSAQQSAPRLDSLYCPRCRRADGTHTELCSLPNAPEGYHYKKVGKEIFSLVPDQPEPPTGPELNMSGVGPTAIRSREQFEREQKARDATPKFANPGVLNPSLNDIRDAAAEATNGRVN